MSLLVGGAATVVRRRAAVVPGGGGGGQAFVWVDPADLPTTGAERTAAVNYANTTVGSGSFVPYVGYQDSNLDQVCLAAAITGNTSKATSILTSLIGSEGSGTYSGTESDFSGPARWLGIGRNLGAYVVAADVLGIRSGAIYNWLAGFRTRTLSENNPPYAQVQMRASAFMSGSNASSQEGFAYAALCRYLEDDIELAVLWERFRRFCGDRSAPLPQLAAGYQNDDTWQVNAADPVGIQDLNATKVTGGNARRIDGAVGNDMSRGGVFQWPPVWTLYGAVGPEGFVHAAMVFHRAGYPAFTISSAAIRRNADYLNFLRTTVPDAAWYDGTDRPGAKFLVNKVYGLAYPCRSPVAQSQVMGFTDVTHASFVLAPTPTASWTWPIVDADAALARTLGAPNDPASTTTYADSDAAANTTYDLRGLERTAYFDYDSFYDTADCVAECGTEKGVEYRVVRLNYTGTRVSGIAQIGGLVRGIQPESLPWEVMKHGRDIQATIDGGGNYSAGGPASQDGAAFAHGILNGGHFYVDGSVAWNIMDGLRGFPASTETTGIFYVRNCYFGRVHDTAFNCENGAGLRVFDCLVEQCYGLVDLQGGPDRSSTDNIWEHCFIRLALLPGGYKIPSNQTYHDKIYKEDSSSARLVMRHCTLAFEGPSGNEGLGLPSDGLYENVTICWLGAGAWPGPTHAGMTVLTGTAATTRWDADRANWCARHGFVSWSNFDPDAMIHPL